ncbi:conserved hypothetical protein [Burkholderia pseudomallei 1106b]|nr:conserved hypothetical protein [Burkholderia pseudomallei MSHR346]EDO92550.1 conserved hypothetical protein [Burkholderia pseudomallei Pasteur 52237]EDS86823.1 conserved hypothetical protein [Burkholderia pseudomallei S13]EEC35611.1 conserved hypothetical protein [Burkholderia pseudomallei 576]EEH26459.1 conserved hypothetical protein [Burkholderia pseudomallei Pakistan 9]EES26065.1 conserved hypothetical protein [Burkholderia pseudomallei 1106b]VUD50039.1 unnamed protein product [Burkhold
MQDQIIAQGTVVRANPPARLMWYFATPLAQKKMATALARMGIPSVYQP